jgi:hypothetical protein
MRNFHSRFKNYVIRIRGRSEAQQTWEGVSIQQLNFDSIITYKIVTVWITDY